MKTKRPSHEEVKDILLADPDVAELYYELNEKYQLLRENIRMTKTDDYDSKDCKE